MPQTASIKRAIIKSEAIREPDEIGFLNIELPS